MRARIIDKDNGASSYTTDVTVDNVAPTATLSNNGPVDEGSPATISFEPARPVERRHQRRLPLHVQLQPERADPAPHYSDGGTSDHANCTFDDGPSDHTVRAFIIDKDDGATSYTTTVHVSNVAPTADLANDGPVDEGSAATISFSNQFDPSSADTTAGFHYEYNCDGSAFGSPAD